MKGKSILFYLLLFVIIFFVCFFWCSICMPVSCDELWTYGFSYNISKGMVIYRDFNVLQTPLYFFIGSIFIKIFGSYLISLGIFNSLLVALIGIMLYRIIRWKFLGVLPVIVVFFPSGYNLLCLFWIILILYLVNMNYDNDFIIGFIIGLCFLSKQNIGLCLCIPYLFYSKNRIKGIISFLLPFLFLFMYLLYNNALYEFIDYCFLGLLDFNNKNGWFIDCFVILEFVVVVVLLIELFKSKFKNKEVFYILMFQIMCYPIFNSYHFCVAFLPVLFYIIKRIQYRQFMYIIIFSVMFLNISLTFTLNIDINRENNMLFLRNSGHLSVLVTKMKTELQERGYSLNNSGYYFTEYYGYLFKLYYSLPVNTFDFLMTGNLGFNGIYNKLDELDLYCNKNRCLFFVDSYISNDIESQWNEFYIYIINNYKKVDEFYNFYIYSN